MEGKVAADGRIWTYTCSQNWAELANDLYPHHGVNCGAKPLSRSTPPGSLPCSGRAGEEGRASIFDALHPGRFEIDAFYPIKEHAPFTVGSMSFTDQKTPF